MTTVKDWAEELAIVREAIAVQRKTAKRISAPKSARALKRAIAVLDKELEQRRACVRQIL
jgi:hypothetical protein